MEDLTQIVNERVPNFTEEQLVIYNTVIEAVRNEQPIQVFIDARGGCGKSYLSNTILAAVRSQGGNSVALAMATTGIAANLLDLGRTFHSRMKAPLTPDDKSTLTIPAQSNLAKLIKMSKLLLLDEATMLDRWNLEALDRTLKDITGESNKAFGAKL